MKQIILKEFGIVPDTRKCSIQAIDHAIANQSDIEIVFEKGRYDFYVGNAIKTHSAISNSNQIDMMSIGIMLKSVHNVKLTGDKTLFVFHGWMTPIALFDCKNVSVSGISIDWEIPLTAEGVVVDSDEDHMDVFVDSKKYPYRIEDNKLIFCGDNGDSRYFACAEFDAKTGLVAENSGDAIRSKHQSEIAPGLIRFRLERSHVPAKGNILALRHGLRIHPGMLISSCEDVFLERMTMYTCGGLGVLAQFSKNITALSVVMKPNTAAGRKVSSCHDDGFQFSNASGHVIVENCAFYALLDDPINVHGTSIIVREIIDDHTLIAEFVHPIICGFDRWAKAGDAISSMSAKTLHPFWTGIVSDYMLETEEYCRITFADALPTDLKAGDALENLTNTPSVHIRHCHFGAGRARGVLLTTPGESVIEDCCFENPGAQILISGDANGWYETGACKKVTIRRNLFTAAALTSNYQFGYGTISIAPEIPEPDEKYPFHGEINIEDNWFIYNGKPLVSAFSVEKLTFANNHIMLRPMQDASEPISFVASSYCTDVRIENNICPFAAENGQ